MKICDEEADGECQGGLCTCYCESNRGTGPFQCCDGWSSDEPAELGSWEDSDEATESFTVGHGSTNGAKSREATTLLKANDLVERRQVGDGNCMFRSLSEAAGKSPEYHRELRKGVADRIGSKADEGGADNVSELGTWGSSEVLKEASEVM